MRGVTRHVVFNPLETGNPEMGTLFTVQTQMKCHISSGSALFAWTKSIFRERNTIVSERISYGPQ